MSDIHPAISALADTARARHANTRAILAYGSALREASPETTLVDLYVLTENLEGVSTNIFAQIGCQLVPPNVHYLEATDAGKTFRAKYAVLPLRQFARRCSTEAANPYFWARFAQPVSIVWTQDSAALRDVEQALQVAQATAYAHAKALAPNMTTTEQWQRLFAETYRTEFRPEHKDRNRDIVSANESHYAAIALRDMNLAPISRHWPLLRFTGKALTLLRLAKASFTFQGGPDYLAWKIQRHSGIEIKLTDFQRRHPLIASITLLPKLLRKGAVK